jgi:adenosylhomocysteine nucleosidase
MPVNPILIQQAYYGAVRGTSHGYLASSEPLSESLQNFLPGFTDRPGNDMIPAGVSSYLSGAVTDKLFLLSRTWPDETTTRAGMVFTHVLLLPLAAVPHINDLAALLALLLPAPPAAADRTRLPSVTFCPAERLNNPLTPVPSSWRQLGQQLLNGAIAVTVSAEPEQMAALLVRLWNGLLPSLRPLLTWATCFSRTATGAEAGLLVGVPPVVAGRWAGQPLITLTDAPATTDMSLQEQVLWNAAGAIPFRAFLGMLEIEPTQFRALTQHERAFTNYERLTDLSAAELMSLARDVAALQPVPAKGVAIKKAVLSRLNEAIATSNEPPLRNLRKFSLAPFADASALEAAVVTRVNVLLAAVTSAPDAVTEAFDLDTGPDAADNQPWLRAAVDAAIVDQLRQPTATMAPAWWLGVQHHEAARKKLLTTLASTPAAASVLTATAPTTLDEDVAEPLLALSRKRGWWALHAAVAAASLLPAEALRRQVLAEGTVRNDGSPQVPQLAQAVANDDLLALALETNDSQLLKLAGAVCAKDSALLSGLDVADDAWRQIWEYAVSQSDELTAGLTAPTATVDAYLSLLIENPAGDFPLLPRIARSSFADVLHHPQRSALWAVLPAASRLAFLKATAHALTNKLVDGQRHTSIEAPLRQAVQQPAFTTQLLSTYRADLAAVLAIQDDCDNLTDRYLADYVAYLPSIKPADAVNLGRLINSKRWSLSAQKVADRAKHKADFRPALAEFESQLKGVKNWFTGLFINDTGRSFSTQAPYNPSNMATDVLIMTALGLESNAVQQILSDPQAMKHPTTGTRYTQGIFAHNGRQFLVALAESGAGNIDAAQATERALSHFKPRYAFFVGVGGGIKDVSLGDVVASSEVLQYEGGKDGETFKPRIKTHSGAHELTELAKFIANRNLWQHRLGPHGQYKAEVKPIAAGEKVVASNRSATFNLIDQSVSQAIAVEMEGYGFLAPVHSHHAKGIVIRGISDLLVDKTASADARWQPIAAANAAAFAAEMLAHLLDDKATATTVQATAQPQSHVAVSNIASTTDTLSELLVFVSSRGELAAILADLYERGPEERQVWRRAGGKLSFLKPTDAGDAQWHHALDNLAKGGSGAITISSLLETVRTDFPASPAMQHYYRLL